MLVLGLNTALKIKMLTCISSIFLSVLYFILSLIKIASYYLCMNASIKILLHSAAFRLFRFCLVLAAFSKAANCILSSLS